ncbi:hypothetical protein CspHIS471_0203380 [Cutaneotrichosporon sp. HIS471]|nr:hypothetical protein CspHIS471_0203380 [Cutaneotrichosporon sp. HIS471]
MDAQATASASSPGGLDRSDGPLRISQRASNSCSFCTKRKIKCNKKTPCDNCIRRGHPEACTRVPAIVRGRLVNAPNATQRAPLTPDEIRLLREGQLQRENLGLRRRLNELENRLRELEGRDTPTNPVDPASVGTISSPGESPTTANAFAHLLNAATTVRSGAETERSRQDEPDVLEPFVHVMAMPLNKQDRPSSPHPRVRQVIADAPGSISSLPDLPSRKTMDLAQADLLTLIPTPAQSMTIIRASLKYMSFLHYSCHIPSFIVEHDEWIQAVSEGREGGKGDAWLSYYFSLLSVGMYFCGDLMAPELNLSVDETSSLSSFWFDVCLEALNRSKFMSTNPTLEALQTIVVLPMVSYNFGASAYTESLLHVGLRLAQLLKLHLLTAEPADHGHLPRGLIQREVGRRVWLLLRLGEGRPDFVNTGGLRLPQGQTVEPFNANPEDYTDTSVNPRPFSQFAVVTHILCAGRRYRIFRQFSEAFGEAASLRDQYAIARAADNELQNNFADFACLQNSDNDTFDERFDLNSPHDHSPHSRYIWSLLMPAGTILVYRSFLGRAYSDDRFTEVRETCLAAAREILRQRRRRVPPMFQRTWPIASYTVLAGVVLATELVHGSPKPAMHDKLVSEIQAIIDSLWLCGTSSLVVQRGVPLLRRFIDSSEAQPPVAEPSGSADNKAGPSNVSDAPMVPAAQELWPGLPPTGTQDATADTWMNASEDVWSNALVALENDEASGWWTTLL